MTKKKILLVLTAILLLASLVGGVVLVKHSQEVRKDAACAICGPLGSKQCIGGEESECKVSDGQWCWESTGNSCSDDGGGSSGGFNGGGTTTDDCASGGWHEGAADANACADDPDNCCGGACVKGLVFCPVKGRCQNSDEFCPGGTDCNPSQDCTFSCGGSPEVASVSCSNDDCAGAITRDLDICRGRTTNSNCQRCNNCTLNDPAGCDLDCDCPNADPSTCYEKGPYGYEASSFMAEGHPALYGCRNTQSDVIIDGAHVYNCTWEDGRDWDQCFPDSTPTPTVTPSPTPTGIPTQGPGSNCNCVDLAMYDLDWNLITDYSSLESGDRVYFLVTGRTDHPDGITQARVRVNGGDWQVTTDQHGDRFYIEYEIPDTGSYSVEAQVYNSEHGWN